MQRHWIIGLALAVAPAAGAAGQNPPPMREALLRQVVERFIITVSEQAGLDAEQAERFRGDVESSFAGRREREQRERQVWRALESQMRPGVAADADSVARLLDALVALRNEDHDAFVSEMEGFATYLSPVQRAQVAMAFERLRRNVEDMIRRRMQQGPGPRRQDRPG